MSINPNKPIDLAFIQEKSDLNDEERAILGIAQSDDDALLEESDFATDKAQQFVAALGVDATTTALNQFCQVHEKLVNTLFQRALPDMDTATRQKLSLKMLSTMEHSDLANIFRVAQELGTLHKKEFFSHLESQDQQATLYMLMVLEDGVYFNDRVADKKINATFSRDMARVVESIHKGEIRVQKESQKVGAEAEFFPDSTHRSIGTISFDEDNKNKFTLIHEAMHAKQHLSQQNAANGASSEKEAYLVEATYEGLEDGFETALARCLEDRKVVQAKIKWHEKRMVAETPFLDTPEGRARWLEEYIGRKLDEHTNTMKQ